MSAVEQLIKQLEALPYPESERQKVILETLVEHGFFSQESAKTILDMHITVAPTTWLWLLAVLALGLLDEDAIRDTERITALTGDVSPQRLEAVSMALSRLRLPKLQKDC